MEPTPGAKVAYGFIIGICVFSGAILVGWIFLAVQLIAGTGPALLVRWVERVDGELRLTLAGEGRGSSGG